MKECNIPTWPLQERNNKTLTDLSQALPDYVPACLSTFSNLETTLKLRPNYGVAAVIAVYTEDNCGKRTLF